MDQTHMGAGPHKPGTDELIRANTFERENYTRAVIRFERGTHSAVQSSLLQPIDGAVVGEKFGALADLPIEVISTICMKLDCQSVLRFSHASRRAREILSLIPPFRRVIEYGLDTLYAILKTGYGRYSTIGSIDRALTSPECIQCGHFGCYYFILTASRYCPSCLLFDMEMLGAIKLGDVARVCELRCTEAEISELFPVLHTLPGTYVDLDWRRQEWIQLGRDAIVSSRLTLEAAKMRGIEDAWLTLANCEPPTSLRFRAATRLPYLDAATGTTEDGLCCKGCRVEQERRGDKAQPQRMFLRAEFLDHVKSCKGLQALHQAESTNSLRGRRQRIL